MHRTISRNSRTATLPRVGQALTPISFVHAILEAYRRRGMDPARALEKAQIATSTLENPAARITATQMERISGAAMQELDDEALGWFGRRLPWGSYGMLARASISAPHLERALKRWCRHHGLITEDITLRLTLDEETATLSITEHRDLGVLREFCLVSVLRNIHGVACWLIDSRLPLAAACFPFPAPAHHDVYRVLFPGPTSFGAEFASIRFDSRYLALPLRRDESALQQMLQHALPLTVLPYRRDRILAQRVRQALSHHPALIHNAETLAGLLNVSSRTLHRQLSEEGTSLQAIKDEVRQARACELLVRSARPIKQVAELAGFRNEKSFIRAFRGWIGTTPAEYRSRSL
jgi:AraC-like DNA-binding protein